MSLQLKGVGKTIGADTHIFPTDLELEPGTFNTLLGTTLAGKTTLMQLMAGLEIPTQGEIWFDGKNVTGTAVQSRNVSMVYQQFINYPMLSVFENIASPLRVGRYPRQEIKRRVGEIAELLRISPMLNRKPSELSGGQQQRCAMARALVKESDLILLDEPLANLDFKLREELRDELPKLFAERECVVVYATTEPSEALLLGGQTAAMHEGRIVQFGVSSEIYETPNTLKSAQVFSEPPINLVNVVKRGTKIHLGEATKWTAPKGIPNFVDGEYIFAIRPHHVTPTRPSTTAAIIYGIVDVAELSGSESIIHFQAHDRPWISLSHGVHPFAAGTKAKLYADVVNGLYFTPNGQLVTS